MDWNELKSHELTVYSTKWCPDCHRLKAVLDGQAVNYTEIDIDADPAAADRLQAATGRTAIPFIQIDGGPFIRGWHNEAAGKWNDSIFFSEVEEAIAE